jgi:thiol:disulfide interchange protein DsbD
MNRLRTIAAALVAGLGLASAAFAQDYPAKVTGAKADPVAVSAGHVVTVRVDVEVDPTHHIYGLAQTENAVPPTFHPGEGGWPAGLTPGAPTESPAPETEKTPIGPLLIHRGKVTFSLPFTVAADAAKGERVVEGSLELMACDESTCQPPVRVPFKASLYVNEPSTVKVARAEIAAPPSPGGTATIEIELSIADKWHVYAQRHTDYRPPQFEWTLPEGWKTNGGIVEVTEPHEVDLFGDKLFVFEKKAVLRQSFDVPAAAPLGKVEIRGLGAWQRCDEGGCIDDKGVPVAAMVSIVAAGAAPGQAAQGANPAPEAKAQSLGDILLSGMGWGLLTILTPCVFPLLPVTVSFFSKQQGPALPRSTVYALGIVFTLTVIGLVFKSSLDVMARGAAFNIFVGALFIVLAMSLFGLFELRLPSFLIDRSQEKGGTGGLVGPFFMAVTLALTSFSCSVPFLALMFARFDKGHVAESVLGLLAYSSTVAFPFFLCSLFPSLLKSLPKSGGWLNAVKVTMGFVELGLAFKFLRTPTLIAGVGSDWLPRSLVLAIWIACSLGAALYLFGYIVLPHDTKPESIGPVRLVFAVAFLTIGVWLVPAMFGGRLPPTLEGFIQTQAGELSGEGGVAAAPPDGATDPPPVATGSNGGGTGATKPPRTTHEPWPKNDWDGALARAVAKKRPALFDFTGVG